MAKTNTPKEAAGGRPPGSKNRPADEAALGTLQSRLDRSTALLVDHPSASIGAAFGRAAAVGIPRAKCELVLKTLQDCVEDLEETLERVYTAPAKGQAAKQRVVL